MSVDTPYNLALKPQPDSAAVSRILANWKGLHPLLARLLTQRGYTDFDQIVAHLNPNLDSLDSFGEMKGQISAVARLRKAIETGERILLYGDYDVDGTCSVAMMQLGLSQLGGKIETYIPDRFSEGYGVSDLGAQRAVESGVGLMITLDCGIRAVETLKRVCDAGVDVIVCDHHIPGASTPAVFAILNPMQADCPFAGKELCGCGVGFVLLRALCEELGRPEIWKDLLDFVAVATCADIVPLKGINRVLVSEGMKVLETKPHLGFSALLNQGKKLKSISVGDVVFRIAPRINAAGRLAHASLAVALLTAATAAEAEALAMDIEALNLERRRLDQETTLQALSQVSEDDPENELSVTVLSHPTWQKGVVGIVASRIMERYYRPTIILAEADGQCTGSARSVRGVNIFDMLNSCSVHLERYGGHAAAAGLTIKSENLAEFKAALNMAVGRQMPAGGFRPQLEIDLEIGFSDWYDPNRWRLIDQLSKLEPFGPENMQPVFLTRNCTAQWPTIRGQEHLAFTVSENGDKTIKIPTIAFKMAGFYDRMVAGHSFDLAYTIGLNEWQNEKTVQLEAKAIIFGEN